MSRAGGDPLLVTRVDITGNTAPLEKTIAAAKVEAEAAAASLSTKFADESFGEVDGKKYTSLYDAIAADAARAAGIEEQAQKKVGKAYDEKGKAIKGADQELRANMSRVIGGAAAVGGLIGAIDGAIRSYEGFANAAANAADEAEKVRRAIGSGMEVSAGLTEYEKQLKSIAEKAFLLRRDLGKLETPASLNEAIERLALGMQMGTKSAKQYNEELYKMLNPLVAAKVLYDGINDAINDGTEATIKKSEAEIADGVRAAELAAVNKKREDDAVRAQENKVKLRKELITLQNQELEGVEKIRADEAAAIDDIIERVKTVSYEEQQLLFKQWDQIKINADLRVKRYEEEQAKRKASDEKRMADEKARQEKQDRDEQERIEKQARAFKEAYADVFSQLRKDAASVFPADQIATSIERVIELIETIADQRSRL